MIKSLHEGGASIDHLFYGCGVVFGFRVSPECWTNYTHPGTRSRQVQLYWPAAITDTNQSMIFPEFQVLYGTNLTSWRPVGGKLRGLAGVPDQI
jgi:hypothetical protein